MRRPKAPTTPAEPAEPAFSVGQVVRLDQSYPYLHGTAGRVAVCQYDQALGWQYRVDLFGIDGFRAERRNYTFWGRAEQLTLLSEEEALRARNAGGF